MRCRRFLETLFYGFCSRPKAFELHETEVDVAYPHECRTLLVHDLF